MITVSDKAKSAIRKIRVEQGKESAFFRIGVKGGGCSGMTYDVKFDESMDEKTDRIFEVDDIKVVSDIKSLLYLDGMTIDYSTDLVGAGFRFVNPKASGTCGCGTSFNV